MTRAAPRWSARLPRAGRVRFAQVYACAVEVCCVSCGAAQPSPGGSEMWELHELRAEAQGDRHVRPCVSCDAPLLIHAPSKALMGAA